MKDQRQVAGGWLTAVLLLLLCPASLAAQSASSSWPVLASPEKLNYNLLWPSGISLGEAVLQASRGENQVRLEAKVIADLPQYHVAYTFTSVTTEEFCSIRFRQILLEGGGTVDDAYEFDQQKHEVHHTRNGGTATTASISDCARDPLALLYYFRQQLALGKMPLGTPEASVRFYLGGELTAHYSAVPSDSVHLGSKKPEGDRVLIRVQGSQSTPSFEVWIRSDVSRVPVALRIPFSLGTFSAELE
jgi:uncharacterized protein DUF3108